MTHLQADLSTQTTRQCRVPEGGGGRGRDDTDTGTGTSALIASQTIHPSSSELFEPFPTKTAYRKYARICFSHLLRFSTLTKAYIDISSQLGDVE